MVCELLLGDAADAHDLACDGDVLLGASLDVLGADLYGSLGAWRVYHLLELRGSILEERVVVEGLGVARALLGDGAGAGAKRAVVSAEVHAAEPLGAVCLALAGGVEGARATREEGGEGGEDGHAHRKLPLLGTGPRSP